jgi:uncharacterized protein (DUF58 family)
MNHAVIAADLGSTGSTRGRPHAVHADLRVLRKLEFKAQGFSFLPRQPVHSILAGRHASRLRGRGLNFEEMRRYLPGDDIRNMDWKVTARTRQPYVRVYTEERDRPCLLLVDQRRGMFFGSRRMLKSVAAAELAAIAAWRTFHSGDRVGAIVFNDEEMVVIRPHRSRNQVIRILKAVVEMNHRLGSGHRGPPDPAGLTRALERAARVAHHDHLLCAIAGGGGADEETVRVATRIARHNDLVMSLVYDPMEEELPEASRLVVADGELQLEIDGSDRGLRQQFREQFRERLDWMRRVTRQRETPLLPISTHEDVAVQLRRLLHPPS